MQKKTKHSKRAKLVKQLEWYSFLLPTMVCLIVLTYIPIGQAVWYSLNKVSKYGTDLTYVGFKNYINLLQSERFLNSISNTFVLALMSMISVPLGFLLAVGLQEIGKGKIQAFFRVTYYLPNIITGVSIVLMFRYILMQQDGLLNNCLSTIFGQNVTIGWLIDANYSKIGVTIISAWSGIGYCMLICLAGLQSVPDEIYEAAAIDGARQWSKLIYITVPCMVHTFTFLLITRMISGLSRFSDLYMLGGSTGSPAYSLQTILMYVYQYSFSGSTPNFGLSSAAAMIFFVIVMIATLINLALTNFGNERQ